MKHSTLLLSCLAAATLSAAAVAPARLKVRDLSPARTISATAPAATRAAAAAKAAATNWQPATVHTYFYDIDAGEWLPLDIFTYTYNADGKFLTEKIEDLESESTGITYYTYDSDGRITTKLSKVSDTNGGFVNNERETYAYDPIVPSLITDHTGDMWINEAWTPVSNNYRRDIIRNSDGNITEAKLYILFQGEYDHTKTCASTFGADKKATSISFKELDYDGSDYFWRESNRYDNIVWENTDGQIYQVDYLTTGANRIKSATRADKNGSETYDIVATYTPGSDDYTITYTGTGTNAGFLRKQSYKVLDAFGSYQYITDDSLEEDGETYSTHEEYTYKVDAWGNLLLEELVTDYGDGDVETSRVTGTVTYDDATGLPAEHVTEIYFSDYEGVTGPDPDLKTVFSDYVDVTGIRDITAPGQATDAPVEYYTLQGVRLDAPTAPGLYIRRQGTATTKIMIR